MKKLNKIKQIAVSLCLGLLFSPFPSVTAQEVKTETIAMDGIRQIHFECPKDWNYSFESCGSITTTATQVGSTVTITVQSNGYSKSRVISHIYTKNPDSTDKCNPIIYNNFITTDFFKIFDLPEGIFIDGPSCVALGSEYTFSVLDILSPSRQDFNCTGTDEYTWTLPEGLTLINKHENGHLIRVKVESIPTAAISCKIGKYTNASTNTLYKSLLPKSIIPEIVQQPEPCLSSDIGEVIIEVKKPMAGFSHEWQLSSSDWNKHPFATDETIGVKVNVFTSSGEVRLLVYGECDTAIHVFKVSRAIGVGTKIVVDTLLSEGDSTYYSIYPSPNQHIQWTFPEGWHTDIENEYSSTVYVCPMIGQAAESGQIIATSRLSECATSGDTLTVYMKTYPPAPISVDGEDPNLECFSRNQEYTFKSDTVRHGVMYVWNFPKGWSKSVDTIRSWNHAPQISVTAKPLSEASNGQIRLSVFGICGDSKDTIYDIKFTPKDIKNVVLLTDCLNKGMDTYTSIFEVSSPENGVNYTWTSPNNWDLDTTSQTKLFVNKIGQTIEESANVDTLKVIGENVCGLSNEFIKIVKHEGAVHYEEGTLFNPSIEWMSEVYDWEGSGYEDYDTWIVFLSAVPMTDQVRFAWFADSVPISEDPLSPQIIRLYTEGAAYITCEYKLASGGCTTRLGTQVETQSMNSPALAPKNNLISQTSSSQLSNKIRVYPNPSHNEMTIRIPDDILASKFVIYNSKGQSVKSFTTNNSKEFTVDVSDLQQGIYMLRSLDASATILTSKIIIRK